MASSSATKGFFQQLPILPNQLHDDATVRRILRLFVPQGLHPSITPGIEQLCHDALSSQVLDWVTDAERNQPYLSGAGKNAFGQSISSKLVVSEGWRRLQDMGFEKGLSAQAYESNQFAQYTRIIQYVHLLLWEGSAAVTTCPQAMQDGASRLLQRQLTDPAKQLSPTERQVFQDAYERLTSRHPAKAWTSGQWMTERSGGSDVSLTETIAVHSPLSANDEIRWSDPDAKVPLGPWSISGFKWFSSATDSSMTILLARTASHCGLSAFFAPTRRWDPSLIASANGDKGGLELNGISVSRMKNKMGTKALPTAELELSGMRGWLIGKEGQGIQEISTILTITRVRTAIGSLGFLSRGLAIARAFTRVREVGAGRGTRVKLSENPLHMRTLSDMTVEYHAMSLLTFYGAYLLGLEDHPSSSLPQKSPISDLTPPLEILPDLLRVMTPIIKAHTAKQCIPLIHACMESLGGVGYLENVESEQLNVARLFRDAGVLSIWEGTTDVLSSDLVRVLKQERGVKKGVREGNGGIRALDWLIKNAVGYRDDGSTNDNGVKIFEKWRTLSDMISASLQADLMVRARTITWKLAEILTGALLIVDTRSDADDRSRAIGRRYFASRDFTFAERSSDMQTAASELRQDQIIVFGRELAPRDRGASRL